MTGRARVFYGSAERPFCTGNDRMRFNSLCSASVRLPSGFSSEDQQPFDHRPRRGLGSADDLLDELQRRYSQDGLIGSACLTDPCNFQTVAEQCVVLWLAFRLRESRARIVRASAKTYVRLRSAEPMINARVEQLPFGFGACCKQ